MVSSFFNFVKNRHKYLLVLFLSIFVLLVVLQTIFVNKIYKEHEERFAYQQAKILSSYILEYRFYYQGLFLDHTIELNKDTLRALPAFALVPINESFSRNNPFEIGVRTVSDNAKNPLNKANKYELSAMERFRKEPNRKEIFEKIEDGGREFYQYSYPLIAKESCLVCHASKESAPDFIAQNYDGGYGYKLGDLRGVLSVTIPKEHIEHIFWMQKLMSFVFDVAIFGLFGVLLFGAYKMLGAYNRALEDEVRDKTLELRKKINDLNTYKRTLDDSSIVSITDKKGNIKYVNENFTKASGYTKDEVIGKNHSIVRHPETSNEIIKELWDTILSGKIWKGVLKNRKKDGGYYVVDITIEPILDANGEIIEFIAARHDITEIYDKQKEIERLALFDTLCNIGNRTKLNQDIKMCKKPSIAIFDIDRFTDINDFYGHEIGDALLVLFGKKLQELISDRGSVYRYSSDRFALLCDDMEIDGFVAIVLDIQAEIKRNLFVVEEKKISVQASVAVSFEDKESVLKTVDMALSELKKRKGEFLIYSKSLGLEREVEENLKWSEKLKLALKEDRIIPFFQPILNNKTLKIEKYEALARLIDSDGTIVSPFRFLSVAKRTKQYLAITKKIIEKTFETFKESELEFSINLTMEDILSEEISMFLDSQVEKYGKGRVVFEIVESEGIEDFKKISGFIQKSKECSCKIAIDDFGTGYSNFEYLIKLNPDYIKIDGSMIKEIDTDIDKQEIVKTIIDFAKKRNLKTIAEFVSSKDVFDKVVELGIDYSQGYYIGEPKKDLVARASGD